MIATSVNLYQFQPLKLDQLTEGSCVAEVFAENINFIQTTAHLPQIEASEQFSYNTGLIAEGRFPWGEGLSADEAVKQAMFGKYGILPASEMPFDPKSASTYPTDAQLAQAQQAQITGYTSLHVNPDDFMANINTIEQSLTAGTPVECAIVIRKFYWSLSGLLDQQLSKITWTPDMYNAEGLHKLYIVGVDIPHDWFIAKQSWGPTIGDVNQLIAIPRTSIGQDVFEMDTINGLSGALGTIDVTHTANKTTISDLYVSLFNRSAEKGGMDYWTHQVDTGTSAQQVANTMVNITGLATLSNKDFVDTLYVDALGRVADAGGESYWTGQLNAGTSRGDITLQIISAVKGYVGTDAQALYSQALFTNKELVSNHYAIDMASDNISVAVQIIGSTTSDVNSAPTQYTHAAQLLGWLA